MLIRQNACMFYKIYAHVFNIFSELQESSEREQDDITAVPKTCGGFKKKDIDF